MQVAHIEADAGAAEQVLVGDREDIGRLFGVAGLEDVRTAQKRRDHVQRDAGNGLTERGAAHLGREPDHAVALTAQHRPAIDEGQFEHVTGVDQVRILNLWIGLPDIRPTPRIAQKQGGNVPQGVAFLYDIGIGMAVFQHRRRGVEQGGRQQQQATGDEFGERHRFRLLVGILGGAPGCQIWRFTRFPATGEATPWAGIWETAFAKC